MSSWSPLLIVALAFISSAFAQDARDAKIHVAGAVPRDGFTLPDHDPVGTECGIMALYDDRGNLRGFDISGINADPTQAIGTSGTFVRQSTQAEDGSDVFTVQGTPPKKRGRDWADGLPIFAGEIDIDPDTGKPTRASLSETNYFDTPSHRNHHRKRDPELAHEYRCEADPKKEADANLASLACDSVPGAPDYSLDCILTEGRCIGISIDPTLPGQDGQARTLALRARQTAEAGHLVFAAADRFTSDRNVDMRRMLTASLNSVKREATLTIPELDVNGRPTGNSTTRTCR